MSDLTAKVTLKDATYGVTVSKSASDSTTDSYSDRRTIQVGTSEETHTIIADITGGEGPGWCIITNNDSTNFVQVGIATTSYFASLAAGESMLVKLDAGVTALYLKADTAACDVTIDIRSR